MKRLSRLLTSNPISTAAPVPIGAAALAAFIVGAPGWLGLVCAAAALALILGRRRAQIQPEDQIGRILAVGALSVGASGQVPDASWATAIGGGGLALIIGVERLLTAAVATGHLESANLSVRRGRAGRSFSPAPVRRAVTATTVVFGAAATAAILTSVQAPMWISAACTAALTVALAAGTAAAWRERRSSAHPGDGAVREALATLGPRFIVHFSGPSNSAYQLRMWLPHLDRVGEPYLIVCREREHLDDLRDHTDRPIVLAPTIAALEQMLVDSVRAVYYVNNAALNTQLLRFGDLTHVQLFHGESDKASSFNRVTAIYDQIFVAGQAAVDRYRARGVDIPDHKFRIVGRPQLASVEVGARQTDESETVTMLYAPTWAGLTGEFDYSSLVIGKHIVAEALRREVTLWLRPHPYTRRNAASARHLAEVEELLRSDRQRTGRKHQWGPAIDDVDLADCINAADIAVTDVSGAAVDWLYSNRPFAICDMGGLGEEAFAEQFWIARGAYHISVEATGLDTVFDELLKTDSRAGEREATRRYFLGEGDAADALDRFVRAVRESLEA
ncbi:CDP-glycerol glycerophosphotransferase family protein [Glycomyces xiaoerkulensis]|uniref:CDP-glycerol glycerophosphotransferase family protein n=1 Tax=Glycomyces xiaoerkulensis TaxID=2038139 RepID=UPI000C263AC8|nr:CDP-glycerol glycerophosphotransferase family protein [Glycomyces xiaoerkulensis]